MNIIQMTAQNFMKLKLVRIRPDGSLVVVGGRNAQGKSAVLNAMISALGGKAVTPDVAVREGEDSGFVDVDLGEDGVPGIKVHRTYRPDGGGSLTVTSAEGLKYPSPQKMLSDLVGRYFLDPLLFARSGPREQLDMLRQVTGLDFSDLDRRRKGFYDRRTEVNRRVADLDSRLKQLVLPPDVPTKRVVVADLMREMDAAREQNRQNDATRANAAGIADAVAEATAKIKNLQERLAMAEAEFCALVEQGYSVNHAVAILKDIDLAPLAERLAGAEQHNRLVDAAETRKKVLDEHDSAVTSSRELTAAIEDIDEEKQQAVAACSLPVEGMGFGDDGVLFNGLPFAQASSAEQLRVSVALAMAANPKLRDLFIFDGSLLDRDNLAMIATMAEERGYHVWMERVGQDETTTIVMEDGEVLDPAEAERQAVLDDLDVDGYRQQDMDDESDEDNENELP